MIIGIVDNGFAIRKHRTNILNGNAALKHALQGVFAKYQLIGHFAEPSQNFLVQCHTRILPENSYSAGRRRKVGARKTACP